MLFSELVPGVFTMEPTLISTLTLTRTRTRPLTLPRTPNPSPNPNPNQGVFTMELVMPVARSADGVVAPLLAPSGGDAGLLRQYQAGETKGLLVFVGHVDLGRSSRRITVSLSLPKTKSCNLLLEQKGGALRVRYGEPIAPLQAFHAALALAHWLRSGDLQRAPQR